MNENAYQKRKRRTYELLAEREKRIREADEDTLDWQFWCHTLELVERLPRSEQEAWKRLNMAGLRRVVGEVDDGSLARRELSVRH